MFLPDEEIWIQYKYSKEWNKCIMVSLNKMAKVTYSVYLGSKLQKKCYFHFEEKWE
jgi:hypothetical protein